MPVLAVNRETGMPRYWATLWLARLAAKSPAFGTLVKRVPYLSHFYEWCDREWGQDSVDIAVGSGDVQQFQNQLESYLASLTLIPAEIDSGTVHTWDAVRAFAKFCATEWSLRDREWLKAQMTIQAMPRISLPLSPNIKFPRALPERTLNELLTICNPELGRCINTHPEIQWRNWLIVLLLLEGLRRAEVLLLLVDSLHSDVDEKTGEHVHWVNVQTTPDELEDTRYSRPSIKTVNSVRQIPVSAGLVAVWERYVNEYRLADDAVFLIVSTRGGPLSAESVNSFFASITGALSEKAIEAFRTRTGNKKFVSPHDLRHTRACDVYVQLMAKHHDEKYVFERMQALFGWEANSDMPGLYAAAAIKDELGDTLSRLSRVRLHAVRRSTDGRTGGES